MLEESANIKCMECNEEITITPRDAHINYRLNGKIPKLRITVICPHCQKESLLDESITYTLLEERIKARDFDSLCIH